MPLILILSTFEEVAVSEISFPCLNNDIHPFTHCSISTVGITYGRSGHSVYRKSTDADRYLYGQSNHPAHGEFSISTAQSSNWAETCTDKLTYMV